MSSLTLAIIFLIKFLFEAYIYILMARLLMQKFGASWHNPISQFVIKLTDPIIKPVRKLIPSFKGFDLTVVIIAFLIEVIVMCLLIRLQVGFWPGIIGLLITALGELTKKLINIIFVATIVAAILSWFPTVRNSAVANIVVCIVEPFLAPLRKIVPIIAGFDLSPIALIILTQLLIILVVNPVIRTGLRLALT